MDIVGEKNISNAIALNNVAMNVTWAIGPAVGGTLVAAMGPANCFWLSDRLSCSSYCYSSHHDRTN